MNNPRRHISSRPDHAPVELFINGQAIRLTFCEAKHEWRALAKIGKWLYCYGSSDKGAIVAELKADIGRGSPRSPRKRAA